MQLVWKIIQCIYFSICITIHPIWWIIWRVNHVFTEVDVFCTFSIATVCRMCYTIMQLWLMTNTSFKRVPTIHSISNNNTLPLNYFMQDWLLWFFCKTQESHFFLPQFFMAKSNNKEWSPSQHHTWNFIVLGRRKKWVYFQPSITHTSKWN